MTENENFSDLDSDKSWCVLTVQESFGGDSEECDNGDLGFLEKS